MFVCASMVLPCVVILHISPMARTNASPMASPRVHKCLRPRALPVSQGYPVIPCGQCAECLRSQANQLSVRVLREAHARGPFIFVTLTYAPDHVPVWCNEYDVDTETGEAIPVSSGFTSDSFRRHMFNEFAPFDRVRNKKGKYCKRLKPYCFLSGSRFVELYYSVNYEDVKKSFKSWRMDYMRHHDGRKVDDDYDFKVMVVPEYGGASYRPHYHICFLGLPRTEVEHFCGRWRERFGFAYVEVVDVAGDSSDFAKVSSYLSKYACKGSFDCPFIRQGFCRKPHRGFSKDFGVGDKEDFAKRLSFWRCEDVYPGLDFMHPESYPRPVNPEVFASRRHYRIGRFVYPFPSYFKRKAFFHRVPDMCFSNPLKWTCVIDSEDSQFIKFHYEPTNPRQKEKGKVPTKVVATPLSRMVASALLDKSISDLLGESGFVVLLPSSDCSYRQGFRRSFRSCLDSETIDESCLSGRFSTESVVDFSFPEVDAEKARVAAIEAEFSRSLMDSLF